MKLKLAVNVLICITCFMMLPSVASADDSADFLFTDYEEFYETDIENGPWVYHTDNLTICIKTSNVDERLSYIADIYIRDNLTFYTGWARQKPPGYTPEMPYLTARRYSAVFGLTGDFVSHEKNDKGVHIRDGNVYFDKEEVDTLAVLPTGELKIYEKGTIHADELLAMGVKDALSFGPILVKDGKMTDAVTEHPLKPKNIRTGIGKIEDGHYIAIIGQSEYTFTEYAELFLSYGCEWVYNLDGGHSASMVIMGEQVNRHRIGEFKNIGVIRQRRISDVILLGTSPMVPDVEDDFVYEGSR